MKGTLISSDFIKDSSGNYKFLELNTDAGISNTFIENYLDLSPFINFISASSPQIDTVEVVYKPLVADDFVNHLSESLNVSASFVTSFVRHEEDLDTIYPTSPTDSDSKFILRLAYDENAILDSIYAKDSLGALKLLHDNASTSSVGFYFSSSYDGEIIEINSLEKSVNNSQYPDLVQKTAGAANSSVSFLKLNSGSSATAQINSFISESNVGGDITTNFVIHSDSISSGVAQSVKSYSIIYGTTLSSIHLGSYNTQASFGLPTSSLVLEGTVHTNAKVLSDKHYLEFSTATRKERRNQHGLYETEKLVSMSGDTLSYGSIVTGSVMKSYHIEGLPNTDDVNEYSSWTNVGATFPLGSEATSSVVTSILSESMDHPELVQYKLTGDSEYRYATKGLSLLVYDSGSNITKFVNSQKVDKDTHYLFNASGSLVSIEESNVIILNETTGSSYAIDVESSDLVLTNSNTLGLSFIFHNIKPGPVCCFAAGTQITLSDGSTKNIEDIVVDDTVLGWNGESLKSSVVTAVNHKHTVNSHADACKQLGDEPSLYTINNTGIEFTPEHPFLTKEGWKSLVPDPNQEPYLSEQEPKVLKVGDFILRDGEWEEIDTIGVVRSIPEERVYNITVDVLKSYVANGIVVHNKTDNP